MARGKALTGFPYWHFAGRELVNDARLIKEEAILDGTTIMAAISPHANAYTRLTPEQAVAAEAASPAFLLAQTVCLPLQEPEPVEK